MSGLHNAASKLLRGVKGGGIVVDLHVNMAVGIGGRSMMHIQIEKSR